MILVNKSHYVQRLGPVFYYRRNKKGQQSGPNGAPFSPVFVAIEGGLLQYDWGRALPPVFRALVRAFCACPVSCSRSFCGDA